MLKLLASLLRPPDKRDVLGSHLLTRRQMVVMLLSLAFWATALADDGKGDGKDDKDKSGKGRDGKGGDGKGGDGKGGDGKGGDGKGGDGKGGDGNKSGSNSNNNTDSSNNSNRSRIIYDSVSVARNGTIILSSGQLQTNSPWIPYLAPGMWVRAQGTWAQDQFKATNLEVADPAYFSYYRGPGAAIGSSVKWVEAWYSTSTPNGISQRLLIQTANASNEVVLLVRSEGGKLIAAPPGLPPIANPPQGWILVKGEAQGDTVRWKSFEPFNR